MREPRFPPPDFSPKRSKATTSAALPGDRSVTHSPGGDTAHQARGLEGNDAARAGEAAAGAFGGRPRPYPGNEERMKGGK